MEFSARFPKVATDGLGTCARLAVSCCLSVTRFTQAFSCQCLHRSSSVREHTSSSEGSRPMCVFCCATHRLIHGELFEGFGRQTSRSLEPLLRHDVHVGAAVKFAASVGDHHGNLGPSVYWHRVCVFPGDQSQRPSPLKLTIPPAPKCSSSAGEGRMFICNQPSLASLQRRGIDRHASRQSVPSCAISGYRHAADRDRGTTS